MLVPLPHQANQLSFPAVLHSLFGIAGVGLALDDVVVDSPPVLPVLLKETGDHEDVRHCLRDEDQLGMSSGKVFTEFILTVPLWTA